MELYQLEQFITIVEAETISKAAELLGISQPGLTRSIQRLEDELKVSLFHRKKNRITLNENGILAITYAKKILKESEDMISQLRNFDERNRIIKIGSCAPAPVWALQYIFEGLYPDRTITNELNSDDDHLLEGLKNHQYSIVVLHHSLLDKNFKSIELFEECLSLSLPPAHPLALFKEISFKDLNGESILLLSRIGFWNEICLNMIPQSHLLIQEDNEVFNELTRLSALPNFTSNVTRLKNTKETNRVSVPIVDKEAHAKYYAVFHKDDRNIYAPLKEAIHDLDWQKIL